MAHREQVRRGCVRRYSCTHARPEELGGTLRAWCGAHGAAPAQARANGLRDRARARPAALPRARCADRGPHFIETSGHLGAHALAADPVEALADGVDFGFPRYDQDALEIASVSDSSDCNHVGNGVQCRFYNHEGCARGNACLFSHAPDEKSVRDDLCVAISASVSLY